MPKITLVLHDIRSTHNVGSLFRTAEVLGVEKIIISGYTPFPTTTDDPRLPHIARKIDQQIQKTALGTETIIDWQRSDNIFETLSELTKDGYQIVGLEQTADSIKLNQFSAPDQIALVVGREVEGIDPTILAVCDQIVEIPQLGRKESLNVVQATAIAIYSLTFTC